MVPLHLYLFVNLQQGTNPKNQYKSELIFQKGGTDQKIKTKTVQKLHDLKKKGFSIAPKKFLSNSITTLNSIKKSQEEGGRSI